MKARWIGSALAVSLVALPALAQEHAVPRDGSSGAPAHSAATPSFHSGTAGNDGSSRAGHVNSEHQGTSSSAGLTGAQRRQPQPGTGTGDRWRHGGYSGGGYWRGPGYSHRRYGYGYYDWWYAPYGWYSWGYAPGYSYRYRSSDSGSLRLLVEPSKTRVYVDGYYAGIVDDFDGIFQRLNLPPGRHELSFKLEGYKTHRVRLYVPYDHTIKVHHDMERGEGEGVLDDSLDKPGEEWARRDRDRDRYDRDDERERRRERSEARRAEARDEESDEAEAPRSGTAKQASLRLSVRPEDASIYVDGSFRGTARELSSIDLRPGKHRIEVVRPGFRTFEREVDVASNEPTELNIELERP